MSERAVLSGGSLVGGFRLLVERRLNWIIIWFALRGLPWLLFVSISRMWRLLLDIPLVFFYNYFFNAVKKILLLSSAYKYVLKFCIFIESDSRMLRNTVNPFVPFL